MKKSPGAWAGKPAVTGERRGMGQGQVLHHGSRTPHHGGPTRTARQCQQSRLGHEACASRKSIVDQEWAEQCQVEFDVMDVNLQEHNPKIVDMMSHASATVAFAINSIKANVVGPESGAILIPQKLP